MSTKIYNGYLLKHGLHPMQFAASLEDKLRGPYQELFFEMMLCRLVSEQESIERRGYSEEALPLLESQRLTQEVFGKHADLSIQVGFGYDLFTDRNVMLFYGPNQLAKAFDKLPEVSEYGYWNISDKPRKISEQAWNERREVWDRVLPGEAVPASTMAFWSLTAQSSIVMPVAGQPAEKLESMLPSVSERARRHARQKLSTEHQLNPEADRAALDELLQTSESLLLVRTFEDCLEPSTIQTYLSGRPGTISQHF